MSWIMPNSIKQQWKKKDYKKINLDEIVKESFEMKPYIKSLNVADSRVRFKLATKMLPTMKMNFQTDNKFTAENEESEKICQRTRIWSAYFRGSWPNIILCCFQLYISDCLIKKIMLFFSLFCLILLKLFF